MDVQVPDGGRDVTGGYKVDVSRGLSVRRGDYSDLVPLPAIIAHDVSGVVEAVGPGVSAFKPGDAIWCTPQSFGGLRQLSDTSRGSQPPPRRRHGPGSAAHADVPAPW